MAETATLIPFSDAELVFLLNVLESLPVYTVADMERMRQELAGRLAKAVVG